MNSNENTVLNKGKYLNVTGSDDHALAAEYPLLLMRDDDSFVLRHCSPLIFTIEGVFSVSDQQNVKNSFPVIAGILKNLVT
jgi:hypothetical protein